MRRSAICLVAASGYWSAAAAQPADCPSHPAATQTVPLQLDLAGLPGVPKGIAGQVYADVPAPPPGGTTCAPGRPPGPFANVLAGKPGHVLGGPSAVDLLRGP